jgi:polyvinyl alcohol dehydrogenase (cytochrome)
VSDGPGREIYGTRLRWLAVAAVVGSFAALLAISVLTARAGAASGLATFDQNWSTYLYNNARTGYDSGELGINTSDAATLSPAWSLSGLTPISTEVIAVDGVLYFGTWNGDERAVGAATGKQLWATQIGSETDRKCVPAHVGVGSTATLTTIDIGGKPTLVDFVGGGGGSYYAINAASGRVIWSHSFGSPKQGYFMWSSPAIYHGSVYVGIASFGSCPDVPGLEAKLDAATGAVQATFHAVPVGCTGAGIWASPAIDDATGDVYEATGNDSGYCSTKPEPHAEAVIELSPQLKLLGSWRIPHDQELPEDSDFGATPTLFTARIDGKEQQLVGDANKNGIYYAFIRGHVSQGPVWESKRITPNAEMIASTAFTGNELYVAGSTTVIDGTHCEGSIREMNPSTGAFGWQDCLSGGANFAAVIATPGMVWDSIGSILYGIDSSNGKVLFHYQERSGAYYYAPVTFYDGALFLGSPSGHLRRFIPSA